MDYSKNYINWIAGLTKDQFDQFIKAFTKDFWKVENVVITDGKSDGGIDVKIFQDKRLKKIPIQVTIDKNLYGKLEKDLAKISKLIDEHEYSDSFFFFYSRSASESKVIDLKEKAREEFSINLEIFDNKVIASYLDKPNYFNSRETLRNFFGEFLKDEDSYFDENQKLYFDYLSYADDSKELKERFLISFILNELYVSNSKKASIPYLRNKIQEEFVIEVSENYCSRLLNNLISTGKIEKCVDGNFRLVPEEIKSIKTIRDNSEILEKEFSSKLQLIINKSDCELEIRKVIELLNKIFQSEKRIDLKEISEDIYYEDISKEIEEFHNYVKAAFNYKDSYKNFINEIFKLCSENNFLAKISAGKLFKDLINNPEFSSYARRTNKEVFIDTPVLIYLLLVMKDPDYESDNYNFKIAKELFELIISGDDSANFNTTQLYITELADHFKNAIRLIPLHEAGIFESLGGSDNEFLNMYMKLEEQDLFNGSFKNYLESYGISVIKVESDEKNEYLKQAFFRIFKDNKILIDDVPPYNKMHDTKKDFDSIENSLANIYTSSGQNRTSRSLLFDSLLFCHINSLEDLIDPTVITWDKSFNEFRREFLAKNPNFKYWHLFKPGKFLDHISLLKFKINGSAISNEILSMIETEYEVVKNVKKLTDVLTSIIDLRSSRGITLSKGLADIRDTYIYQINKDNEEKVQSEEILPVDNVVSDIVNYYSYSEGEFDYHDFTESLKEDKAIEEFLRIVKQANDHYLKYSKLTKNYKEEFDQIIKLYKEQ